MQETLSLMGLGFANAVTPINLLIMFLSTAMGITIGCLPGLSAAMGVALLLPITFGMDPASGLITLGGIYCGAIFGGSISAILIHTPGTPASAATAIEGYELTKKGQAAKALTVACVASFIGGLLSCISLYFFSPLLAQLALQFKSPEYFWLSLFGLTIIAGVSNKSLLKGLISGVLGLLISTIGMDPMEGVERFMFDQSELYNGINVTCALIGLFSMSQVLVLAEGKIKERGRLPQKIGRFGLSKAEMKQIAPTTIRSWIIGNIVGILPGAGATIASFMCYTMETKLSKHPEKFGTGIIDGIAASEASNNAATGGAMVPLLSLGIPGGNAAAVMMSALTLKGVQLGPLLLTNQPTYLSATFMSMIVTNILMVIVAMAIAKVFAQILAIPYSYLGPIIMMLALIGTYGDQMSATSVQIMVLAGILGLVVRACHLNSAAIVLGLVLGNMCEQNFSRGYLMSKGSILMMFNPTLHPIAFVLIIVCIVLLVSPVFMAVKKKKAAK